MQINEEGGKNTQEVEKRKTREEVGFDCEKDVALLCCTSGTTGPPKAVMLSHRNVVSNILQSCGPPGDRFEGACLRGERYIVSFINSKRCFEKLVGAGCGEGKMERSFADLEGLSGTAEYPAMGPSGWTIVWAVGCVVQADAQYYIGKN